MTMAIVKTNLGTFHYATMLVKRLDTIIVGRIPAFILNVELVQVSS